MREADRRYLLQVADALDEAERLGPDEDAPEGCRYIQISHALAEMMAAVLRGIAERGNDED